MDNVKPWQIILIIVAIGALGFSVWKFALNTGPDMPDSVTLVDVKTGDLFSLRIGGKGRAAYYPEKHPDTGERTLLPVIENEDGTWRISGHSLPALQDVDGATPAVENNQTGAVSVSSNSKRRISR